jgi:predicted nucleic acid-binding protein
MERSPMNTYVLDASVAVKWYSLDREGDMEKADRLLQMYVEGNCDMVAPVLISFELANALRFNPNLLEKDVSKAMRDFHELQITLEPPWQYIGLAVELAFKFSLTVYDAAYAALAQTKAIPLITADYKFWRKVRSLPFVEALKDLKI